MRLIVDSITYRIVVILILGAVIIGLDVWMIFLNISDNSNSLLRWVSIIFVLIVGLLILAYLISRQLVKPLKQLSLSAKRFSVEINSEAIVVNGPIEVREAALSFNLMQETIQRFVEERMQLIAAISHDLRTPVTRLRLRIEKIKNNEHKLAALVDIDQITEMIRSTLNFIRDDSVIERSLFVDISSMLQTVCDDTTDTIGPALYQGPKQCVISCKPVALRRALTNLIENAVRYGNTASVELKILATKLAICISDTGPGIPENEIDKVFIPFYRIEKSRNRNTGGVGLGLSVAKSLLQSQGAAIDIKNGHAGLVVVVTLTSN